MDLRHNVIKVTPTFHSVKSVPWSANFITRTPSFGIVYCPTLCRTGACPHTKVRLFGKLGIQVDGKVKCGAQMACGRCVRAGVVCILGYTEPRGATTFGSSIIDGRPRRHARSQSFRSPEDTAVTPDLEREWTSTPSWHMEDERGQMSPLESSPNAETSVARSNEDDGLSLSVFYNHSLSYHLDTHDSNTFDGLFPAESSPLFLHQSHSPVGAPEERCRSQNSHVSDVSERRQRDELDVRLLRLNLRLCEQLSRQQPDRTLETQPGTRTNGWGPAASRAFGDALAIAEEYISTLRDLGGLGLSSPSSPCSFGSGSKATHCVGARIPDDSPCILNIESCYIRLVELFNVCLVNLRDMASRETCNPGTPRPDRVPLISLSNSSFAVLPEVRLDGFVIRQAGLRTKILCQAIRHQFESIEILLGLPIELRVSGRDGMGSCGCLTDGWATTYSVAGVGGDGRLWKYREAVCLLREHIDLAEKGYSASASGI
ncbi:uncharacterized protein LY79DRAFT_581101 [Colletotrichum navitas]|uniref:Uncharacterized protein n=1 Tax=Colletotrichum navitas TaxID=681940 RepID=A0AAD8PWF4_9PEZI|nr:uncharacterized protein LY79DRAFT_581101 [Colletotrichum navitas]KAK1585493.1 hypothetical protein LY79DRAFT_581101 [Colletotrichum navitas]